VGGTVVACAASALMVGVAGALLGHRPEGLALALGLLLGSVNGVLALRALGSGTGFVATGLGRLALLSAAGIGAAALIDLRLAPLVLVGIAIAQLILAVASAVAMVRT
jgi:hypothetical protein